MFLLAMLVTTAEPATLSPKEISEGWIMLFDGESDFGWKHLKDVKVENGTMTYSGALEIKDVPSGRLIKNELEIEVAEGGIGTMSTAKIQTIRTLNYRPKTMTPLFDGKTLDGWKLYKGEPKRELTKFEVTKDGEIHLSGGPGDLQTEKSFDNFLLQFECKTNGTALNSGVFFRCLPGQYQQGYECQINNGFKENDRTKPTDFGTGAIYRRVAARKVVSNDKEWFTVTILAVGPNIRTWVNGYPVVNWTDDRKPADNARNGLYEKAGPISLQGHDPTTDILFRNIRIVEVKK